MDNSELPGYHLKIIQKGTLGKISKIREELEELEDANKQQVVLMELIELSDLYGAMVRLNSNSEAPNAQFKNKGTSH